MNGGVQINSADEFTTVDVGDRAPDFILSASGGGSWRLSDCAGKVTALLFYPKNETLVCTRQMCSLRDNWTDYLQTKAVVVGVSPGTVEEHETFSRKYRLPVPILADVDRVVTKIFSRHWLLPVQWTRAVVVVNANGIIACRRIFCRAFRPTDKSVIASIYAARADALVKTSVDLVRRSNEKLRTIIEE